MIDLQLTQGSPEWLATRAKHPTASEAPAMMGASKYQTRAELLRQKYTGLSPDVSSHQQKLFDKGHETEVLARAIVEEMIGEDLFPITATDDDGYLLASFDGVTMDETTGFEHKLWNAGLSEQVKAGELDPHYYWQLEQQILVGTLHKILFVCSDGTRENFAAMEYRAVPGRAEALLAGWEQFAKDLAEYVPPEAVAAPVAAPVKTLPAIIYKLNGTSLTSNLADYKAAAAQLVKDAALPLETDQDFADRENLIKEFSAAEERIKLVSAQAVGEIKDVDQFCRYLAEIGGLIRQARLSSEKQVAARKEAIKLEILAEGRDALVAHIAGLNAQLGKPYMPTLVADFAGAMKGKRNLDSLRDAVATTLATAKIQADAAFRTISANLASLRELAAGHAHLFPDTALIIGKANDDLVALIKTRIADDVARKEAEQKRVQEEADRKAKEKAEAEARATIAAEQAKTRAEQQERDRVAAANLKAQQDQINADRAKLEADQKAAQLAQVAAEVPAPVVHLVPTHAEPINPDAMVKLGEICHRLGITVSADFLADLWFPATIERSAKLYRESDFPRICQAIARHVESVAKTIYQKEVA